MSAPLSSLEETNPNILLRTFAVLYGVASYAVFLATFLYSVGFVGNLSLPATIDRGHISPPLQAIAIDLGLVLFFAVQHSGMARQSFKRWCTRFLPVSIERSTYVLFTSLALFLLFWQWRPVPNRIWTVDDPLMAGAISGLYWIGWTVVLVSTFLTSHFQFFGLLTGLRTVLQPEASCSCPQSNPFLQIREASALSGLSIGLLGDTHHDGGSFAVCASNNRLHIGRGSA